MKIIYREFQIASHPVVFPVQQILLKTREDQNLEQNCNFQTQRGFTCPRNLSEIMGGESNLTPTVILQNISLHSLPTKFFDLNTMLLLREILNAYEILGDTTKRKDYDIQMKFREPSAEEVFGKQEVDPRMARMYRQRRVTRWQIFSDIF